MVTIRNRSKKVYIWVDLKFLGPVLIVLCAYSEFDEVFISDSGISLLGSSHYFEKKKNSGLKHISNLDEIS